MIGKVMWDAADPRARCDDPRRRSSAWCRTCYLRSVRIAVTPLLYYVAQAGEPASTGSASAVAARPHERDPARGRRGSGSGWPRRVPIRTGFVDEDLAALYDADEQRGQIFAGFALFAVLIACLGLFGLASFTAERRTKEIGIRKVLGASVRDIVRLLVWQFSRPVIVANLIAWPVAFWLMRDWLDGFRYAHRPDRPALPARHLRRRRPARHRDRLAHHRRPRHQGGAVQSDPRAALRVTRRRVRVAGDPA